MKTVKPVIKKLSGAECASEVAESASVSISELVPISVTGKSTP